MNDDKKFHKLLLNIQKIKCFSILFMTLTTIASHWSSIKTILNEISIKIANESFNVLQLTHIIHIYSYFNLI